MTETGSGGDARNMMVFEAVADAVALEGSSEVFGLMGDANLALWSALSRDRRVRVHHARHEAAAVGMADGWFRATGHIGVATITNGPGLTNAATSLIAAARNRSAMVVITGEVPADTINPLQALDQRRFVESCEARYIVASHPRDLSSDIAGAFAAARALSGPVVLAVPNPLWEASVEDGWGYRPCAPEPAPNPSGGDLDALASMVRNSRRPILLAGRGAVRSDALGTLLELGERLGALLGTTLQARGAFADQPWSLGVLGGYASSASEELCKQADLVIATGAELGYYTTWGGSLFAQARIVRIDPAPATNQLSTASDLHLRADARATIEALCRDLAEDDRREGFRNEDTRAILQSGMPQIKAAEDGIDPRCLARRLGKALPPHARVTVGAGHFQGFAGMDMPLAPGNSAEFVSQFGAIGQTLPVALGIAHAEPDRPHLVIEGDGSLLMHLQELESAARAGFPLVILVWNDAGYGAEFQRLPLKGFDAALAKWPRLDYAAIAIALGGCGITLENLDGIEDALEAGFRSSGLFLIDARVSQSEMSDNYRIRYRGEKNRTPHLP